jgi:NAD(P)-dependent dehydrogenase (short-subunit alcohol dehydrogenase family)
LNVFVSGGSQGIGKALVERFCSSNGNIIHYTYNSHVDAALKIKEFISESGNRPIYMHLDVTNREEIKKLRTQLKVKSTVWLIVLES